MTTVASGGTVTTLEGYQANLSCQIQAVETIKFLCNLCSTLQDREALSWS